MTTETHQGGRHALKGTALRSTIAAIEKVYGADGLRAVMASLDGPTGASLARVLPVSWYPVSASAALHDGVRRAVGRGDWEASRSVGREAARIDYTGVYRVVMRAIRFDTVFARLELSWRGYYAHGEFAYAAVRPGCVKANVRAVRGFNTGMWVACAGRTESLLLMTGARAADVAVIEPTDYDCTFEATWLE